MQDNNSAAVGGWFLPLLGIVFITLKLTGYITWSWWWVLLPIYGPIALGLLIIVLALIFARDKIFN